MVIFSFKGVFVYLPGASVIARCRMVNGELPQIDDCCGRVLHAGGGGCGGANE